MKITEKQISFEPFKISTIDNFPVNECTVQSNTEQDVYYSPYWYECVIANLKFETDSYLIDYCKPYVWRGRDMELFGWDKTEISDCTGDFWPNIEKPVQNENTVVIAFRKVSVAEIENNMRIKKEIAKHGIDCQIWED